MGRKGRPTKFVLTYEQKLWDNYNPYHPPVDPKGKQLDEHYDDKNLKKMNKVLTQICNLAGYEVNKSAINIISKNILDTV
jgi:hypothetical protein